MILVEEKTPVTLTDPPEKPSMEQLRALMANPDAEAEEQPEEKAPEAGTGEVVKEVKPEQDPESGLPKGVQKRIEKEVERQSAIQRQIDEAVSKTKAKQDELAKLTGESGSEPVKTPKPEEKSGNPPPLPPDFMTFSGTAEEFSAALRKYHQDYPEWLTKQTRATVEGEFQRRQDHDAAKARWDKAATEHGEEFSGLMKTVVESSPESMQEAISQLENWSKVAVHLGKNPAELTALADKFKSNPIAATAQLGRIEERITAAPAVAPPVKPKAPRLPAPLSAVEAPAEEGSGEFDYDAATPAQRYSYLKRGGILD